VKDKGCQYHPDCFTCPFPDCVKPQDGKGTKRFHGKTRLTVQRLARQGLKPEEISGQLGISLRTVYRGLRDGVDIATQVS